MANTTINVVVAKKRTVQVSTNATAGIINTTEPVTIKNVPTIVRDVTSLNNLSDVVITFPANNDILKYSNGVWINSNNIGANTGWITFSNNVISTTNTANDIEIRNDAGDNFVSASYVQLQYNPNSHISGYDGANSNWVYVDASGTTIENYNSNGFQLSGIYLRSNTVSITFNANSWVYNANGVLKFPDNSTQNTAFANQANEAYANSIVQANIYANNAYNNAIADANTYANNAYNNAIAQANIYANDAYSNAIAQANVYANNAYNNAISYSGNAVQAYSNAVSYVTAQSYANTSQVTSNAASAYTNSIAQANVYANNAYNNAVTYVSSLSLVNTSQLSTNLTNYQTTAGLASNVSTLTSNNTSYVGTVSADNVVSNTQLQSNLANYQTTAGLNANIASYLPNYTGSVNATTITAVTATFTGNVSVSSLIVTGNVEVIGANNLAVTDNMIYLNSNATYTNPDLGFAGNYNDGTYHHAGFFRDHVSGTWKVFDNYLPEPDASIYINQTNSTFHIANFQANTIFVGNTSVYATVNTTNFTGSANNTLYVGSIDATNVVSNAQLSSNLANYSNSTQTASLAATAYSNAVSYVTSQSYSNTLQVTSNAATAYSNAIAQANVYANNAYNNAVSYVDAQSYVNTSQLSSNLANYQTTAGLSANVVKLAANTSLYVISPVTTITYNYTALANDSFILSNSSSNLTITLPTASTLTGRTYEVKNINTGAVTIVGSGTDKIDGYNNMIIQFKNSMLGLRSTGSGWIVY